MSLRYGYVFLSSDLMLNSTHSSHSPCALKRQNENDTDCFDCSPRKKEEFQCVVEAPMNGDMGQCPEILKTGESCVPACNDGFRRNGITECDGTTLRKAVCYDELNDLCTDDCTIVGYDGTVYDIGVNKNGVCDDGHVGSRTSKCRAGTDW